MFIVTDHAPLLYRDLVSLNNKQYVPAYTCIRSTKTMHRTDGFAVKKKQYRRIQKLYTT